MHHLFVYSDSSFTQFLEDWVGEVTREKNGFWLSELLLDKDIHIFTAAFLNGWNFGKKIQWRFSWIWGLVLTSQTSTHESQPDSWVVTQQPEESTSVFSSKLKSSEWTLRTLTRTVSEDRVASEPQQWQWTVRWATVLGGMGQEICTIAINPNISVASNRNQFMSWSLSMPTADWCIFWEEERSVPWCFPYPWTWLNYLEHHWL